jgi:hypothetical protein
LKEVFPTANIETSKKTSNEGCAQDGVGPLSAQAESRIQARSNSNAVQQGATMATLDLIGSSTKFPGVLDAINTGAPTPAPLRPASTGKITTTTSAPRAQKTNQIKVPVAITVFPHEIYRTGKLVTAGLSAAVLLP